MFDDDDDDDDDDWQMPQCRQQTLLGQNHASKT